MLRSKQRISWYLGLSLGAEKDRPIVLLGMHDPKKWVFLKEIFAKDFELDSITTQKSRINIVSVCFNSSQDL